MSEVRKNQDEKDVRIEHSEGANGDNGKEDLETMREDSESGADSKIESYEETGREGEKADLEKSETLTEEEINDLRKKAEERDSLHDKLLRTRAEFTNYQKRMLKENESTAQYAIQELILELFPELDNFDRALKLAEDSKDLDKFVEGIKLIEDQLLKVLGKYGVKSIETVGKAFDPNLHEAVMEEENNEIPHHTIICELQKGYLLKGRVIRPAKVKVSKRTGEEEKETEKPADEEKSDNLN